jgi:hypothetical protein
MAVHQTEDTEGSGARGTRPLTGAQWDFRFVRPFLPVFTWREDIGILAHFVPLSRLPDSIFGSVL